MNRFEKIRRRVLVRLTNDLEKACGYWKAGNCWSESFIDEMAFYNNLIGEAYYLEDMDNMSEELKRVFDKEEEIDAMF